MESTGTALITQPMAVFAVCASLCALVFWSTTQSWTQRFYRIVPSIALVYYLPTFATTFGLIPADSVDYPHRSCGNFRKK